MVIHFRYLWKEVLKYHPQVEVKLEIPNVSIKFHFDKEKEEVVGME